MTAPLTPAHVVIQTPDGQAIQATTAEELVGVDVALLLDWGPAASASVLVAARERVWATCRNDPGKVKA